ncbi:hypothetical protein BT63DRAFT_428137 [Microthyrium microscopicum]|uniref:Uncharacterized protein n=1 Tax=Microthyrium microscopicum TaxID=703497 RepID=A0A6A6U4J5_9PEZI|nr:hypothetical protein BT63DRAFT_428137 [Microthyrium microscopicum]
MRVPWRKKGSSGPRPPGLLRRIFHRARKEKAGKEEKIDVKNGNVQSVEKEKPVESQTAKAPVTSSPEAEEQPSTFNDEKVEQIFSGAPKFGMDAEDAVIGVFPYAEELRIRDASDCVAIAHPAFSACTAKRHMVPGSKDSKAVKEYQIGVWEVPNMLKATGREPGTVGYDYFLEEPISDASGEQSKETAADGGFDAFENINLLNSAPERLGLRKFDLEAVGNRLSELAAIYGEYRSTKGKIHLLKKQTPKELYTKLFTQILSPPRQNSIVKDPNSVKGQIQTLVTLLNLKSIWYDFSSPEWRIRAGQVLWTAVPSDNSIDPQSDEDDRQLTDRDVLILQLDLACELLLRLDAISSMELEELEEIELTAEESAEFRELETKKSRWDLVFARSVLRNVEIKMTTKEVTTTAPPQPQKRSFPFFSLTTSDTSTGEITKMIVPEISFLPQDLDKQLSGLFHFAKAINWPDSETVEQQLRTKVGSYGDKLSLIQTPSVYATPMASPRSFMSQRSSYFDTTTQPDLIRRSSTPLSMQLNPPSSHDSSSNIITNPIGGWLTRSYLTGLVLPGESLTHLLLSSLLENDASAIAELGDSASLYGGFVLRGRSWWSAQCIVGRVLAALDGSAECMGWLSIPAAPTGVENGWFDIASARLPAANPPRIKQRDMMSRVADFAGGVEPSALEVASFSIPVDATERPDSGIKFEGLHLSVYDIDLSDSLPSPASSDTRMPPQTATLHFSTPDVQIPLRYLVTFISAYPCFPEPTAPALGAAPVTAHPLHTSQAYRTVSAESLFSEPPFGEDEAQSKSSRRSMVEDGEAAEEVEPIVIVDARGNATLALFARAWCAWKGEHAIVGRVGTSCIACCVREARAIGVRLVIRVE